MIVGAFLLILLTFIGTFMMTRLFARQNLRKEIWEQIARESSEGHTGDSFRRRALDIVTLSDLKD